MAEISNDFGVNQAPAGIFYPQDFSLEKLNFITSSGQKFDMKKLLVEMSYYEDIYSFCISGSITIRDSVGFIELLQLSGSEYMEIDFGKIKGAANSNSQTFHVYKLGKRLPTGNLNDEFYTLHFCSEELYLSEQLKISKSFQGKKISEIINNIVTNTLKVESSKINIIEPTIGVYSFIVPRFKPFEAISWLSTYARPNINGGADMLFYQNRYGYNFRSLQSIYKDSVYATYKYQQKNLSKEIEKPQDKITTVLDYEFIKTFDVLGDTAAGTYANRLISIDPFTKKATTTNFDYEKYQSSTSSLNGKSVLNPTTNRLGVKQNKASESVTKLVTSNANQSDAPYIKQAPGSVAKDIYIETYVPNRTAQIALSNYTLVKIMIPGDPGVTAGSIINFSLMTTKPTNTTREEDKFYSGKYLVTAVRHILSDGGSFVSVLEIAKDSNKNKYSSVNMSSTSLAKVVKS